MDLGDVTPANFFKKLTYASDATVYAPPKMKIQDEYFILFAILLRLENTLRKLK